MTPPYSWQAYYVSFPNGRCRITRAALAAFEMAHRHRVLALPLKGRNEKVLLLDKPLMVGERIRTSGIDEHSLLRVRLCDIPGWPPRIPPRSPGPDRFPPNDSRLASARFKRRQSPALPRVELVLSHPRGPATAVITGPPVLLLKCVEATLRLEGAVGQKLRDLQDMRLVGPE